MKKILILLLIGLVSMDSFGNIELPSIFSDNMVLQRNSKIKIWGWGNPGEKINIVASWNKNDTISTKVDRHSNWSVEIKTNDNKNPQRLDLYGYNHIKVENILFGEVWLASGQSNMEWNAAGITKGEEAIENATNKKIRFFQIPKRSSKFPQQELTANWRINSPETMQEFSAIAYFFANKLSKDLGDIPIGIIGSYWGGTPAEIWIPKNKFEKDSILQKAVAKLPKEPWGPNEPAYAFNAMIHPITNYKIAGVVWYQGESNTSNAEYYQNTFKELINSWREVFNTNFPFYYAQIAPYDYGQDNFNGVIVREAQRKSLNISNTGMVFTGDVGNPKDIHPRNKKPVGERFANLALNLHYNKIDKEYYGPLFTQSYSKSDSLIVEFSHAKELHFINNQSLFEVAGQDSIFYPAEAVIKNTKVILSSNKVNNPLWVRYAWKNDAEPNLMNEENLPASGFLEKIEESK
ncbi:sialate O-acetylesterase [Zunongwangia mangrovi]|uniref:Sialate O-acetylesterase n=1 Tax=Zunongwangia mangrovi TaxID=1334022 RepID=A0A1I1EI16_9FLAO|nr:sialate O-acetylesterase [Zunongwangia mangrovi]SFB84640.1 sialate O-acetylesterase [Zunongwangia mangrovi]